MSAEPLRHGLLRDAVADHGFGVRGASGPPDVLRPRQVHGSAVVPDAACRAPEPPAADAVVSDACGVAVGVVTADCVPILAAAADGSAVAAIHAGWRGMAQGVIEAGVAALARVGEAPLVAVVGPHIGACCYEVDEPVLAALGRRYGTELDAALTPSRPGHARLDLGAVARRALARAGLAEEAIGGLEGTCTACDSRRFHSYRRDGPRAGRLLHFVRGGPAAGKRLDTAGGGT